MLKIVLGDIENSIYNPPTYERLGEESGISVSRERTCKT